MNYFSGVNTETNAKILLKGMWYSELPDILDMSGLSQNIMKVLRIQEREGYANYAKLDNDFIEDMKDIVSPDYIRFPGVEAITYYSFKKDQSLREMQIPNLVHYISFIYNSLWVFEDLYEKLYMDVEYGEFVENSNSYIVFGDEFIVKTGYDECEEIEQGVFTSSNNKIQGNQVMVTNKERYESEAGTYRYGIKMDIESFFPNIYTHYLDKIKDMKPYDSLFGVKEYFTFLDHYHQRINNNQTKGIPAGVFSAHIASELLMLCVDERIRECIRDKDMGYIRYVDDLTFFSDSKEMLLCMPAKVQKILNDFRLRLNSNKSELFSNAKRVQQTDLLEIERILPWVMTSEQMLVSMNHLYALKQYIAELLDAERISQVKSVLTNLNKRLVSQILDVSGIEYSLMCYAQVLALENVNLACHCYKIMDTIMANTSNIKCYKDLLMNKTEVVDSEYEDTLVQIWHYYVLLEN